MDAQREHTVRVMVQDRPGQSWAVIETPDALESVEDGERYIDWMIETMDTSEPDSLDAAIEAGTRYAVWVDGIMDVSTIIDMAEYDMTTDEVSS